MAFPQTGIRAWSTRLSPAWQSSLGTRVDARADGLAEGQRRLECMLDRLVVLYLAHTWEVPPELHASAIGKRQSTLRGLLASGGGPPGGQGRRR